MKKRFLLTMFLVVFALVAKAVTGTHWTFNTNTQYQCTFNGVLVIDGESMLLNELAPYYEVGAFVGEECRGSYLPDQRPPMFGGGYIYQMTIFSEVQSGETLSFRVYNHQTEMEMECGYSCQTTLDFVYNANYGNALNPIPVNLNTDPTAICYDIYASANPQEGGTVTGAHPYKLGRTCTLTATANEGYNFVNWATLEGTSVTTNTVYSFTVTGEASYVANFQIKTYAITATANPTAGGTVTGAGTYNYGQTCTLTATPAAGYLFVNWTKGGSVVSTNATCSFTANDGVEGTYVANFSLIPYEITATANPTEGGTVNVAGQLTYGTTCTLTATPAAHYNFVNWTKGNEVVSTNAVYSFTVEGPGAYVANFELASYEITATVNPTEAGTVTGMGNITYGQTCTLTATANDGYEFVSWIKGGIVVSTNAVYSFTVEGPGAYVANFDPKTYNVTVAANPTEGGIVTLKPEPSPTTGSYNYGQVVKLRAVTKLGYEFVNWTMAGVVVSTESTFTVTVTDATEGDYVANFSPAVLPPVPTETHWTSVIGLPNTMNITGIMILDGESLKNDDIAAYLEIGAFVGDECRGSFLPTLYNLPFAQGYFYEMTLNGNNNGEQIVFRVWNHITGEELDVTSLSNTSFIVDGNLGDLMNPQELEFETNLTVHYNITAVANPTEGGSVTGSGSYEEDTECTLIATADSHYNFTDWTLGNEVVSTNASYTFTVTADGSYIANFAPKQYEISVNDPQHGTVEGAGTYYYHTQCVLTATPDEGYHFVNWTNGGVVVSTDESYVFTVESDASFVATFAINTYDITANVSPYLGDDPQVFSGKVNGQLMYSEVYEHFATCTLTATAGTKWVFVNWTENDVEISTDATYEFMVEGPRTFVANFAPIYTITAVDSADYRVDNVAPGTIEAFGYIENTEWDYIKNTDWMLTATANTGYTFSKWLEVVGADTYDYSSDATISEIALADRFFAAYFTLNSYDITATVTPTELPVTATEINVAGTVSGTGNYHHYDECTLVATAETGYHFVNWTENDVEVSTDESYTFMVEGPRALVAKFELDTHEITATVADVTTDIPEAAPAVPGTVTGTGTYNYYDMCTVVATPEVGYHFVNWTENDVEVATTESYEFMVTGDRALVANFELDTHVITATVADVTEVIPAAAPDVPGTVTGADTYNYYAMCTMVATPATGYHFVNWTENDVEVSTEATYEFMVTGDRALVANFELDTHVITLSVADVTEVIPAAVPAAPGTVTGAGTYNYYAMCTVTATPATGYHFVNWTENGTEVATTESYEFMVEGDRALVANFELDTHDITVTIVDVTVDKPAAAPNVPGTVTGDGTYNYYAMCTMVATPATGYHFVNWTENDVEVSTEATYEFMVTGDRALVANFELDTHIITLNVADVTEVIPAAAPAVPGTVTGAGTYNYYAMCTVTATPVEGYHFVNWTENGTEVATTATYEFMVEGDRTLVANFELDTHEIVANINPAETPDNDPDPAGVVTGAGTYNHYATCTLTATANTGYDFVNWTLNGNVVSTEATISFMVEGDATYTANFQIKSYQITVYAVPTVGGSVEAEGYVFDDNNQITVEHFAICTLTAIPATGYHFVNWTDENDVVLDELAATETIYSFMVEGARTLKAHFALNEYEITASVLPTETPQGAPNVAGYVDGTGTYQHFSTCTLTATPSEGYHFMNWKVNGVEVGTDLTYSFEVTGACNVVATFALNSYQITATENPTGYGTITGAGTYTHYSTCTLVGTAGEGHTFFNWTENNVEVSTNATYSFTVTGPRSLVAHFINRYVITVTANPTNGGTVAGGATYDEGTSVTLTATPATGYHFVNWTLNGNEVSTNATYTFTAQAAGDYVANFAINSYEITATVAPANTGTVTGAGSYNHFATCTMVATPATGYHFVNWTENGTQVSTSATYSFEVTGARNLVANFAINSYEITATVNPANTGTVTGAGSYNHFATCTMVATPATGYHFVNWTVGGVEVSTSETYSFEVTGAVALVANFAINSYEITVTLNPTEGGTVTGAGTYNHFETCTLTATPDQVYLFTNWTLNGEVVSTEPTISFTVTGPADYVANFELGYFDISAYAYPTYGGTTTGAGSYLVGTTCTLTGIPSEGFHFVKWTKGTEVVSTDAEYSFIVTPESAGMYRATFARTSYQITVTANPAEGGNVNGSGTYNYGSTCQLIATANPGYHFVNWTSNGAVISTEAIYNFEVHESAQIEGNFAINTYDITAAANPEEGGTVTGAGTYQYGESCTLTATVANGYNFINWTKDNEVVSTDASFTFTVTESGAYIANFEEVVTYEIVVSANPEEYGTVTGGGTYAEGETCTVTATPTSGHMFVNWTENGEIVSNNAEYTFVVTGNRELVANFDYDGVGEFEGITFVLYPNPATDKIMIESSDFVNRCEIYTVNGSLVLTMYECAEHFEVNVNDYAAGSYIIRLFTDKGVQMRRFIKK